MSLTPEQVTHVARLARLAITPAQTTRLAGQLSSILAMIDQLSAADTQGIEPMAHPLGASQSLRLRDDTVTEPDRRALFQSIAPSVDAEAGLYLVPKVIE